MFNFYSSRKFFILMLRRKNITYVNCYLSPFTKQEKLR